MPHMQPGPSQFNTQAAVENQDMMEYNANNAQQTVDMVLDSTETQNFPQLLDEFLSDW